MMTWATRLNHTSAPINAANGASSGLREAPVSSRAPSSCITETVREPDDAPISVNRPALMCATTRNTGTETGHLQKHDAGQRTAGDAAPLQQSAYDAAGHRTGRGRKNEQYCDGDGGKRIA